MMMMMKSSMTPQNGGPVEFAVLGIEIDYRHVTFVGSFGGIDQSCSSPFRHLSQVNALLVFLYGFIMNCKRYS